MKPLDLKPAQRDRVCALAEKAGVPDGFDPFDVKAVRALKKQTMDKSKCLLIDAANLDKILAIIAPPKVK